MIIPIDSLASDILHAIIKEYVLREGTDYGAHDVSLEDKIAQVETQLRQGIAVLVYSELHETVNIMPAEQFNASDEEIPPEPF